MPNATRAVCHICNRTIARQADMKRHLKTHVVHDSARDTLMHHCPKEGCKFKTWQLSNLKTHQRRHTGEKNKLCPSCNFKTSDPAALTRHRKKEHGYIPPPRRAQAPRSWSSSTDGSSRSISPAELFVSAPTSPAESIQELSPTPTQPRPFFTELPVLQQGRVVSAPAPVTLQPATFTQLYFPAYQQASEEQPATVYVPEEQWQQHTSPSHAADYQSWDASLSSNQSDCSWFEMFQSQYASTEATPLLFQPNSSRTVCAPIEGYHHHFAVDDSALTYETMFYNPLLQFQYFLEFQCQNPAYPGGTTSTSFESFDLAPQATLEGQYSVPPHRTSQGYDQHPASDLFLESIPRYGYQWNLDA